MPKPGPVVCAEASSRSEARPPVACRSPARSCAPKPCCRSRSEARPGPGNCPARRGAARPGEGTETGKTDSTTVEITCACGRMTDRARRFANFWKQIEKNDKVRSVYGGSVLRIEKNGQDRRAGRSSRAFATHMQVTTTLPRKRNGRALHLANFRKIEEND